MLQALWELVAPSPPLTARWSSSEEKFGKENSSAEKPADLPVQGVHGVLQVFQVLW